MGQVRVPLCGDRSTYIGSLGIAVSLEYWDAGIGSELMREVED
ncbi:MAG TPA: hypothetical protein VM050_05865 [Patescibacteria group bacterium]|nr:hypothetical protein [Patescibacteria group bacterium]